MLTLNNATIDSLQWKNAPLSGVKSNGEQNTQLQLTNAKHAVTDLISKTLKQLETFLMHLAEKRQRNNFKRLDVDVSNKDATRAMLDDFGATLGLGTSEKDNCSADNYALMCVFLCLVDGEKQHTGTKQRAEMMQQL